MRLNPHFHTSFLDGAYRPGPIRALAALGHRPTSAPACDGVYGVLASRSKWRNLVVPGYKEEEVEMAEDVISRFWARCERNHPQTSFRNLLLFQSIKVETMPSSTVLKFSLKVGNLAAEAFRVHEFSMSEAISECFRLQLQASSEDGNLPYADLIGKDATLTVAGTDFSVTHHGVVTEFNQYPDSSADFGHASFRYEILIEPHLRLLEFSAQNRIFQNLTVKEILSKVLVTAGLAEGTAFKFELQGAYRKREFTVQYNESDYNFISRLMEDEGIFYYFDHSGDLDELVMADKVVAVRPVAENPVVNLESESGLSHMAKDHITKIRRTQRMVTGSSKIKDYNDRTPAVNVIGSASKSGQGEVYTFGVNVPTAAEAGHMAAIRAEMYACGRIQLEGEGLCRDFRSGFRFELKDSSGRSHFEGKYTLVRVVHHGDQREGFEGGGAQIIYTNTFTCMPADVVFRPQLHTVKPKIHGIMTAKVDGIEGPYAYLDDEGRYHAKLPFDLNGLKDGQASLPVRMAQPYGGPDYGMHFPVHSGNDMVLGFVDGDVDRPIALGTVPNPANASPVTAKNKSESVIRTASGHQLRMDDKDSETIIDLETSGKHLLAMDDTPATKQIKIKTSGGHLLILDDVGKNATLLTTGGHTVKIDDAANSITVLTKGGHEMIMDDPGKKIELKDGQGVNTVTLDGGGKFLGLVSTGDIKIDAGKNLVMTAKEAVTMDAGKDMTLHADGAGSFTVDKTMLLESVKEFTANAKKMAFTADTDFTATAKKFTVKAEDDFKVDAGKANIKASGDMILKGSKIAQN
ncbi:MAG: type VI secretion system tip protein TssI/VgrG [Fibrobacteria bacterium]